MGSPQNLLPGIPLIESPLFDELIESGDFTKKEKEIAISLHERGYAIIDFPHEDFDKLAENLITEVEPKLDFDAWKSEGHKAGRTLRSPTGFNSSKSVVEIATNPSMASILWVCSVNILSIHFNSDKVLYQDMLPCSVSALFSKTTV